MACWESLRRAGSDARAEDVGEADEDGGGSTPRSAAGRRSALRSMGWGARSGRSDPWTWAGVVMEKKSRPSHRTLYSSRESLIVQARSSVCNSACHLLRADRARRFIVGSRGAGIKRKDGRGLAAGVELRVPRSPRTARTERTPVHAPAVDEKVGVEFTPRRLASSGGVQDRLVVAVGGPGRPGSPAVRGPRGAGAAQEVLVRPVARLHEQAVAGNP